MDKKERIEKLKKLVELFDKDIENYKKPSNNYNEQMTRQQYIDNFLKLLDWDISNSKGLSFNEREVVAEEYSTKNRKDRPDYTIRVNGVSKFYIEAKKVSVDVSTELEPALQTRRYGWNAGHSIAILTNFEYLSIYLTYEMPKETDRAETYRYKIYNYKEFVEKFDEIYSLISRENVINGNFDKWVKQNKPQDYTKTSLDNIFLEQLNSWRVLIAEDLLKKDKKFKEKNLNEIIQVFLNQIIFLRFAEDNRFENAGLLKEEILNHTNYIEYFKKLDKKYNSELFKNPIVIDNLSNEVLHKIIENLYFPNVSYDFSVIDLSILSKIYENFLQMELVIIDDKVILEKTKSAKIKAVVSTPNHLAISMVHNILKNKLNNKTPDEILNLRIGDLAVGSGIFLIEAYNYLEKYLIDWYSKNSSSNLTTVPFEMKKQIVENVLYGFDINNQAVQLTRFSLLLRLLANEDIERIEKLTPILPSLKENIIWGNSLVNDSEIDILILSKQEIIEIIPLEEKISKIKFDIILGNPPYLQTKELKATVFEKEFEKYKEIYRSAYKQFDKYFLFIEKTLSQLKDTGEAVLLVPNKFINVGSGLELRKIFKESKKIKKIFDFQTEQIWEDVLNYVSVIYIGNNQNRLEYIKVVDSKDIYNNKAGIEYNLDDLDDSHWFLTENSNLKEQYYFAKKNFPSILTEIIPVNGVQTSKNEVYIIPKKFQIAEDENNIIFLRKDEKFSIEKAMLKDFYQPKGKGQGMSYKNIYADSYIIFPYQNGEIISSNILQNTYPNLWNYFNSHKEELLPKFLGGTRDVRGNESKMEWYQFGRTQYLKEVDTDKIIVGVLSNKPNFNIDRNNFVFASGGTAGYIGLFLKENSKYSLEYIEAWLSHNFTDSIFKTIGSDFEGDFYSHGTGTYKDIPLLPINFNSNEEVSIFNHITEYVRQIYIENTEIEKEENKEIKNILIRKKEKMITKVNELIDSLLNQKMREKNE